MEKKKLRRELFTSTPLEIRESVEGESKRTISGYAILFDTPSAVLYEDGDIEVREVISKRAVTEDFLRQQDIKMTMFHDRQLILARSNHGEGSLSYSVDDKGVRFEFEVPDTCDGDKAFELVKRGDLCGCSFMFSTYYGDKDYVAVEVKRENGRECATNTVMAFTGIYDFTLAADPAYPDTSCETIGREIVDAFRSDGKDLSKMREQVKEMRAVANFEL
jgi:HK97 family phage prohead protease